MGSSSSKASAWRTSWDDAVTAATALTASGITLRAVNDVLLQRLRQDEPGQLGAVCTLMADAGVNMASMYSDHDGQLALVVDDPTTGATVNAEGPADPDRRRADYRIRRVRRRGCRCSVGCRGTPGVIERGVV